MAKFMDERRIVENNVFAYEERLHSPIVQKPEKSMSPTTYYHLVDIESSTDGGFDNVEDNIGTHSGNRFHRINDFPLGLGNIQLDLGDTEHGLDSSYEGEALVLPNTIKPVPNSYFVVNYLQDHYLFRVTEIKYDTIRADNFYTIGFKLEDISEEKIQMLNLQTTVNYDCIMKNIGTEYNCLIEHEKYTEIKRIDSLYSELASNYIALFYDDKYNVVLGPGPNGIRLYDPYMIKFINDECLFRDIDVFRILYLSHELEDPEFLLKYRKSVFGYIQKPSLKRLSNFKLELIRGIDRVETQFYAWADTNVYITNVPPVDITNCITIFTDEFVDSIVNYDDSNIDSHYRLLLSKFIRNEEISLNMIPDTLIEDIMTFDWNIELFYITPLILYIIRETINGELSIKPK